ncbi:MAG: hypothetical protein Q9190_003086 [Brigantiaea leucoxantha]
MLFVKLSPVFLLLSFATALPIDNPSDLAIRESGPSVTPTATTPSSKRGLDYQNPNLLSLFTSSTRISWAYNYAQKPGGTIPAKYEFVPLLFNLASSSTSSWNANAKGATSLLAFNEPDVASSSISPASAAQGYKQYMQPFAGKARLGSPATTASSSGLTWQRSFIAACSGCTVDFIAMHWAGSPGSASVAQFQDQVLSYINAFGKPVWVTEIVVTGTVADNQAFMQQVLPWLDAQAMVERYAWFNVDGVLVSSGGSSLTAAGTTYKAT